jgi:hypothetical protein
MRQLRVPTCFPLHARDLLSLFRHRDLLRPVRPILAAHLLAPNVIALDMLLIIWI